MITIDLDGTATVQRSMEPHAPSCALCWRTDPDSEAQHRRVLDEARGRAGLQMRTEVER